MKLNLACKHCIRLTGRDRNEAGWATVSDVLFPILQRELPGELVNFRELDGKKEISLTDEGEAVLTAMKWLD